MHRLVSCSLIAAVAVLLAQMAAQPAPALSQEAITVTSYDGRAMPAAVVRITAPERRARPERKITVTALRLTTTAKRPGHPIVFLMGGPGIPGSVMTPIPPYFSLFQRLRELADVIILDQRGIGRSEPVIDCPFSESLPTDFFLARNRMVAAIRRQVASCADQWRAKGADPTAYNTIESADDIDDLRKALGVEKIDLLAFSYGSRLALAYVQRHGDHVGRVVLQGVNGPGLVLKRPAPIARKLRLLGELLKQDSGWSGPTDLLSAARAARERLNRSPATVIASDRRAGRQVSLSVGREGFDAIVGLKLDDGRLPALLVSVAAGDDRVLTRFVESLWNDLGSGNVGLMRSAVNCAADRPKSRWETVARESRTAPFGAPIDNELLTNEFCHAVGYNTPPVEFPRRINSLAPTLLLTGALDATNPVENARDVARGLSNAILLEVENAAHEALTAPVVQDVIVDFLRGADVRGRRIIAAASKFATVEEALKSGPQRGP